MNSSPDSETVPAGSGEADGSNAVTVDLPEEFQAEVRAFARSLPSMDYYRVLGVPRGSDAAEIREGFFERSKRYHPDRYFRKELGPYGDLLHEIYKRVVAAHDVLRDQKLRSGYDETLASEPDANEPASSPGRALESEAEERPKPLRSRASKLVPRPPSAPPKGLPRAKSPSREKPTSLRKRHGLHSPNFLLRGLKNQLERSRGKAQRHLDEAREFKTRRDWPRCVAALKLAMAFDPRDKRLHDELAEVLPSANAERCAEIRKKGELLLQRGARSEALEYLEEACDLNPTDAQLAHTVAQTLLELNQDLPKAAVYGERAVSLDGQEVPFLKTLGCIYKAAGNPVKARRHLQRAWAIDPLDKDIKAKLGSL